MCDANYTFRIRFDLSPRSHLAIDEQHTTLLEFESGAALILATQFPNKTLVRPQVWEGGRRLAGSFHLTAE